MDDDDEQGARRAARHGAVGDAGRTDGPGHVAPRGWYPDPWSQARYRWWDGRVWTAGVSDDCTEAHDLWAPPRSSADAHDRVN